MQISFDQKYEWPSAIFPLVTYGQVLFL